VMLDRQIQYAPTNLSQNGYGNLLTSKEQI